MKKIYSLLLLSMFLMMGTGSAWAEYYLRHPFNNLGNWTTQTLTNSGDDENYFCYGLYNDAGCNYGTDKNSLDWMGNDADAFTVSDGVTAGATFCKFIYNVSAETITVEPTTITTYQVTVSSGTESAHVYAWIKKTGDATLDKFEPAGEYPGATWGTSSTFKVPAGCELWIKFNNNSTLNSGNIKLGTISSTKSYSFTLNSNKKVTNKYIAGSFTNDEWAIWYDHMLDANNEVTIHLTPSTTNHEFKVYDNADAYGYGTSYGSECIYTHANSEHSFDIFSGNQYPIYITARVEGDYHFKYGEADSKKNVKVTYPSTYTHSTLSSGQYGTICLPVEATNLSGADFYTIAGKRVDNEGNPVSIVLSDPVSTLVKGTPYFFIANGTNDGKVQVTLTNKNADKYTATAGYEEGLYGTFVDYSFAGLSDEDAGDLYIVKTNKIQAVNKTGSGCYANHAYIHMDEVGTVQTLAPGRREIILGENTTTSIETIDASQNTLKYFENGQLRIVRDGVTYDAIGRIVK